MVSWSERHFESLGNEHASECEACIRKSKLEGCDIRRVICCQWDKPGHMRMSEETKEMSMGLGCGQGALVSVHYI